MKRKIISFLVCILLVSTLLPLQTVATQNNEVETPVAGGMAEKVEIKPLNFFLQLLPYYDAVAVEITNNNNVTIHFIINISAIKPDGTVLYYSRSSYQSLGLISGGTAGAGMGYTKLDFIKKGYGIGFFTVEVEIEVVDDHSFKSETFSGFILSF
ncbi:MAG: hypothetical protein JXA91_03425, partial [Candidatus Thermoplasmatota archaeon]|nr:hypothetical protein [Candidatus Thermoplasmatota archaeon]